MLEILIYLAVLALLFGAFSYLVDRFMDITGDDDA
jgi:hypothetical protein